MDTSLRWHTHSAQIKEMVYMVLGKVYNGIKSTDHVYTVCSILFSFAHTETEINKHMNALLTMKIKM